MQSHSVGLEELRVEDIESRISALKKGANLGHPANISTIKTLSFALSEESLVPKTAEEKAVLASSGPGRIGYCTVPAKRTLLVAGAPFTW